MNESVRSTALGAAQPLAKNGLAEALVILAAHHGVKTTAVDLLRAMPADPRGLLLTNLDEAADRLGMDLHVSRMPLEAIPSITLPVIIFDVGGQAMVLTGFDAKRRTAYVIVPSAGDARRSVKTKELAAQHAGVVAFATPTASATPATPAAHKPRRHWFWSTFRGFWPDYLQVVIAAMLINALGIAIALFVKNVYDRVIPNLAIPTLWALSAGVTLAIAIELILRTVRSNLVDDTGRRVDLAVAGRLFEQLLSMRLSARPASAGVVASQLRDFDSVRDVLTSSTVIAITDFIFISVFLAVMWVFVGPLTFVPLIAVAAVLAFALLIQWPLARAIRMSQADTARRHGVLVEAAGSVETVKSIGAEGVLRRIWDQSVVAASHSSTKARFWANLSANMVAFVGQLVAVITVIWGVFLVIDGTITVGALIAASILSGRILAPLGSIVQTLARAHQARAAFKTLDAMMAAPSEQAASSESRPARAGDIEFRNVTFSYPGAGVPALREVSFRIRKGERVGLIGRIGSGKSTVGRLVAGLYQPDAGEILIDGIDIRQFAGPDLRSVVGLCLQEPELFSGSLRDNIVIGHPGANTAEIERVTRISGVDGFAARHPLGLGMPVAERGRSLSGGQRQAIAIARTLIRSPQILFLDEPTSAADTGTERTLVTNLRTDLPADTTIILSTHRDGLLDLVDRLMVFDGGKLMIDGPKAEVIRQLRETAQGVAAVRPTRAGEART